MSSEASIITMILDLLELKKSLTDLEIQYQELDSMVSSDGVRHKVDVAIKDPNGRLIGLQKNEKGEYQFIADTKGLTQAQVKRQKNFINQIKQKYTYNKVMADLKREGYVIAQEEKKEHDTIKIVARKWS
jgi:hypothetical protein